MKKKTVLARKRRGPPATGKGTQVVVRLQPDALAKLDGWRQKQDGEPTRAEALRRLMDAALQK